MIHLKMARILIFLCFIAVSSLDAASWNRMHTARIIGGFNAPEGLYPYQVSLQLKDGHMCGASVISKDYVLTAAHCIVGFNLKDMKAVVGMTKLNEGGSKHAILEAHVHENRDLAVVKVEEITFSSKVAAIPLDTAEIFDDLLCTLSGWGLISFPNPQIYPNHLQHINLTTIALEKCKAIYQNVNLVIIEEEICTLTKVGEGICHTDSGGPLVRNIDGVRKQIGIVSRGAPCAIGFPDVFVRISSYIDWVKEKCNSCI